MHNATHAANALMYPTHVVFALQLHIYIITPPTHTHCKGWKGGEWAWGVLLKQDTTETTETVSS